MIYSFIKVKEDSLAICPRESRLILLPSGYVNEGFCETMVIFVLQVCFIYTSNISFFIKNVKSKDCGHIPNDNLDIMVLYFLWN
jgi:hypothetical protein